MVVDAQRCKPATGYVYSTHAHEPVDQQGCSTPNLEAGCDGGGEQRRKVEVKADAGDEGEDDGSFIRPPNALSSRRTCHESVGSAEASAPGSNVKTCIIGLPQKSPKSALRCSSSKRHGLRVHWAPDVYDPPPSKLTHSGGRGAKPGLSSGRARRHQGKASHQEKWRKYFRVEKAPTSKVEGCRTDSTTGTVVEGGCNSETVALADDNTGIDVKPATSPRGNAFPQAALSAIGDQAFGGEVENTMSLLHEIGAGPGYPVSNKAGSATTTLVDASVAGKSRKKQSKAGTADFQVSKRKLEEMFSLRLAGAQAIACGEVDTARGILQSALLGARSLKSLPEQARCLRLLADTQAGEKRESNLLLSVEAFSETSLAFEHAEALLCLARHKVNGLIRALTRNHTGRLLRHGEMVAEKTSRSILQEAKSELQQAAALLLSNQLASPAILGPSVMRHCLKLDSPTGRRRKSKGMQSLSPEVIAAAVLMGSICQQWGKVCLLLKEFDEAQAQLHAASLNVFWCQDCPEEAMEVQELLGSLSGQGTVPGCLPVACAVH